MHSVASLFGKQPTLSGVLSRLTGPFLQRLLRGTVVAVARLARTTDMTEECCREWKCSAQSTQAHKLAWLAIVAG